MENKTGVLNMLHVLSWNRTRGGLFVTQNDARKEILENTYVYVSTFDVPPAFPIYSFNIFECMYERL